MVTTIDRFTTPIYGVGEAASYLQVPTSTLSNWAFGYARTTPNRTVKAPPIVTAIRSDRNFDPKSPAVPFIGFAEAFVLAAFRKAGVPLQRIRPAVDALAKGIGLDHALASKRLYTDGAEVLYDFAEHSNGETSTRELVVVRNNQRIFAEVVESYLRRISFGTDGYATQIELPQYRTEVVINPAHAFGRPYFAHGGAKLDDALDLFRAGESLEAVAAEFGLTRDQTEDAIRVATRIFS